MKTLEEWVKEQKRICGIKACPMKQQLKIIEHLLGAVRFYSNKNNYEDQKHPHYGEISSAIAWDMAGKTARDAIAAAEKEIGGGGE